MSKQSLVNQLEQALRRGGMVPGTRAAVAVSGGVDSMVLLDALVRLHSRLGLRLHVVHIHHGLRGKAADQDAGFVVAEAVRRGVGVSLARLDPAERPRGISVQVWARNARYASLEAVRQRVKAAWILTAHTLDDQAETVLLNLLRGTGARGLAGIPASRDHILRPLLGVSRAEIEAYAATRQVVFREDASNASDTYRRNRIRHHLLPLLAKEYNPRIARSLAALASLVREDEAALAAMAGDLLAAGAQTMRRQVRLDIARFRSAPPAVARRALQEAFRLASQEAHGLTRRHVQALLGLLTRDAVVQLPGGLVATRTGDAVEIGPRPMSDGVRSRRAASSWIAFPEVSVRPGRWVRWDPLGCRVRVRRVTASAVPSASRGGRQEILSPAVLAGSLSLRAWQPGDRFRPLGLRGQKKLQDFFVDAKVPRGQRARIPLLLAGGRIAWVVGQRVAEDFRWAGRGTACLAEVEFRQEGEESVVSQAAQKGPGARRRTHLSMGTRRGARRT